MATSIQVSETVALAFTDTGAPSTSNYVTVFTIHGLGFNGTVFQRVATRLKTVHLRFVSIARRDYKGSSPFTDAEIETIHNGTEEQKLALDLNLAQELAMFVSKFIEQYNLPPISNEGKGGVAVLGWSLGAAYAISLVSSIPSLPPTVQATLGNHIRGLILLDNPPSTLGLPSPPKVWFPFTDPTIPENERITMFVSWVTAYFEHEGLETRNLDALTYAATSINRVPTIHNIPPADRAAMIEEEPTIHDLALIMSLQAHQATKFQRACFDQSIRRLLPHMKVTHIVGTRSPAVGISTLWAVEAEDKKHGGGHVQFKVIPEVNHFMMWDDPEKTAQVILETVSA